ncbi:hypothetical protein DXA27_06255 [Bacteroides fragilis]|uniref:Uncharacterized protein n=1 Tax=Bacteroides fragilis TaxID=817 RepID=A0A413K307_BACFG|nr:hypothetical protein DXA27_06255 [Bacteroides fragilis]
MYALFSYFRAKPGIAIRHCECNYPSPGCNYTKIRIENGLTGITNYIEEPVMLF